MIFSEPERVLLLGMGGGNDVFSCLLMAQVLRDCGFFCTSMDVAGVLSPFHRHTGAETGIPGCMRTLPTSERFIVRNDGERKIGFVDARVADIVSRQLTDVGNVLGLSLENGSEGLAETLRQLKKLYQQIILIDVGGDVLYAGERDTHVLSPMFDAITLRGFVDSGVGGKLFLAGPGTDGELDPEALRESLASVGAADGPVTVNAMTRWENLYRRFIESHRTGNTVPALIEAYNSKEKELRRTYTARAKIGTRRWDAPFEQRIDTAMCRRYSLLDPARIVNPLAISCSSAAEWFHRTQAAGRRINNEANMQYVRIGGQTCQFLTPSPMFSTDVRDEICAEGLRDLAAGVTDKVSLFADDWERVDDSFDGTLAWQADKSNIVTAVRRCA